VELDNLVKTNYKIRINYFKFNYYFFLISLVIISAVIFYASLYYHILWLVFYIPIYFLYKKLRKNFLLKYLPCPYCQDSILINYKWLCDKCKKIQINEHSITDKCDVCRQRLDTFFCEHCKKEFYL